MVCAPAIAAWAAAAIATTTALWPVASLAAPAYMYSDIAVVLWGGSTFLVSTDTFLPTRVLPRGDPARAEMFIRRRKPSGTVSPTARRRLATTSRMRR